MRNIFRWSFFITIIFSSYFVAPVNAAEPVRFDSSTQFLWGDDLLGESQTILSQYLRFSYRPDGKKFSLSGYGSLWDDFNSGDIRENGLLGRVYYLYMDYIPHQNTSLRLGRQYVNFSAGSSIMDGLSLGVKNIGPFSVTVAGGRDVVFALDSDQSRPGNYFAGLDLRLDGVRATQLGLSYAVKFDQSELAREELGMDFRYIYSYVSPYAEVKYDVLTKAVDEATAGVDVFPTADLMIRGETYYSYPSFDSTSIYSVFAVDEYHEYLVRAEYSLEAPVTLFASYVKQTYEDDEDTDNYIMGARTYPLDNLTLSASVDYRRGYGGKLWGFELTGDYRVNNEMALGAGIQYDTYRRPENLNDGDAQRYWLGGRRTLSKNVSLIARIEDNVNENFRHRPLGRVALNWNL